MKSYIDSLDSVSFAWSRIDAETPESLNTVKGKNGNKVSIIRRIIYSRSNMQKVWVNLSS
jgi:internalin A